MENKTGKYLKYAIGEILLVVIGILIALQVNNWNQQRIASQKEQLLLSALHEEFVENKAQLKTVVSWHRKALKCTRYVISQFPIDPETIDLDSLEAGMQYWGYRYTFNPSQGVIRSLVNTSSFDIVSDPELRILLVSWEDVLADYQEEEVIAALTIRNQLGPKMTANLPWENLKDERYDKSYLASYEFENIFHYRENNLKDILGEVTDDGELVRIQKTIDRIIELSKTEVQ